MSAPANLQAALEAEMTVYAGLEQQLLANPRMRLHKRRELENKLFASDDRATAIVRAMSAA